MFSWTGCTFCQRAKALLTDLGADFTAVEMDERPDGMAIKAELGMVSKAQRFLQQGMQAFNNSLLPCMRSVAACSSIGHSICSMRNGIVFCSSQIALLYQTSSLRARAMVG